jgi:hypothetical protein
MTPSRAFTSSSDTRTALPPHPGARLDRTEAAVASLRAELARLERLGLEPAALRCRRELRYWEFLRALFSLEPTAWAGERARA